jgi:hypothetical protein
MHMTAVNSFTPKQLSAAQYVLALHQPEDRVAVLVRNRARAQTIQRILLAEDIASPRFQDWLKEQNNAGADVFLGMNPLRANSFARTKESVREIRHVYLDLDEDAPASLRAIRTDGNTPVPTFVLDTSPEKNQVVWRVDGLDREQAESLLRSLANQFQADTAATDIARVLRVPGFTNHKYNAAFVVRAIQQSDAIYHRPADCPPDIAANPKRIGPTPSVPSLVATTQSKSSSGSPTTGPTTKQTRFTMRNIQSKKLRRILIDTTNAMLPKHRRISISVRNFDLTKPSLRKLKIRVSTEGKTSVFDPMVVWNQNRYRRNGYGDESTRQEINVSQIRTMWFCIRKRLSVHRPLSGRCTGPEQKGQTYSDNRKHRAVHPSPS